MIATCECKTKAEAKRMAEQARRVVFRGNVDISGSRGKWTVAASISGGDVERWFRMMMEQAQEGAK